MQIRLKAAEFKRRVDACTIVQNAWKQRMAIKSAKRLVRLRRAMREAMKQAQARLRRNKFKAKLDSMRAQRNAAQMEKDRKRAALEARKGVGSELDVASRLRDLAFHMINSRDVLKVCGW